MKKEDETVNFTSTKRDLGKSKMGHLHKMKKDA